MKDRCCGCSVKLCVSIYLWIEAITFTFSLFDALTEIGAYGNLIHTSCLLTFSILATIKFAALYGVNKKKAQFLVPQMASQIMEIIFIAFIIYATSEGFSFMSEVINFILKKFYLPLEELGEKLVTFLSRLVVVPMIVIFVAECCFMKMVHSHYLSMVSKKEITDESTNTDDIPKRPVPEEIPMTSLETMV